MWMYKGVCVKVVVLNKMEQRKHLGGSVGSARLTLGPFGCHLFSPSYKGCNLSKDEILGFGGVNDKNRS